MKFTLNWLKEYLETKATLKQICDKLTDIGIEVEKIIDNSKILAPFIVGYINKIIKHPNSDRLYICTISIKKKIDGSYKKVQVVCGAPNIKLGMKIVFASDGLTIPSNGIRLKVIKIHGILSFGMICSEYEMGISEEHSNIIELPDKSIIGESFASFIGADDPVIEVIITPNRSDCLGVYGIARDLAATGIGDLKFKQNKNNKIHGSFKSNIDINLDLKKNKICKQSVGRLIKNIKNCPSPRWLKQRLNVIGLKSFSFLTDIIDYIAYDKCYPLCIYDSDRIDGNIIIRMGNKNEKLSLLNGKEYIINDSMCVVSDSNHILGLGGIISSKYANPELKTTNIFIKSSYFDRVSISSYSRKIGIQSNIGYRSERGINTLACTDCIEVITKLIINYCSTKITKISDIVTVGAAPVRNKKIEFPIKEIKRLSNINVPKVNIISILLKLGFKIIDNGNILNVNAPEWRLDIHDKQDLVEEIIRIFGFEKVFPVMLDRLNTARKPVLNTLQYRTIHSRRILACRGMKETVTYSFISNNYAKMFGGSNELILDNPISIEMNTMRPSLLPNLLSASFRNNRRGFNDHAIFEVGEIFLNTKNNGQKISVSGIRRGAAKFIDQSRNWMNPKLNNNKVDLYDVKSDIIGMLNAFGMKMNNFYYTIETPDYYHPGRSGSICINSNNNSIGYFGEIHPSILKIFDINEIIVAFEVTLNAIPLLKKNNFIKNELKISNLLMIKRDLAFIVDKKIEAVVLLNAAASVEQDLILGIKLFDVYKGSNIENDKKSLALEFIIKQDKKILTDKEINLIMNKVINKVKKVTGAILRE